MGKRFAEPVIYYRIVRSTTPVTGDGFKIGEPRGVDDFAVPIPVKDAFVSISSHSRSWFDWGPTST